MTKSITPARIRALRQRLGMTQEQFAVKLGLGPWRESVSRLERGDRKPIGALAELLLTLERAAAETKTE